MLVNRVVTRLPIILSLILLLLQLASAKRLAPVKVHPVIYQGIRYVAPNDDGRRGYIEAWNAGTDLGAGVGIGNAGDDFEWMDSWQLYSKTRAAHGAGETSFPHLRGEASLAEKSESGSALIYWNGKRYLSPQQGV